MVYISNSALSQYFENDKYPSPTETPSTATSTADTPESEAKTVIEGEYEGLQSRC